MSYYSIILRVLWLKKLEIKKKKFVAWLSTVPPPHRGLNTLRGVRIDLSRKILFYYDDPPENIFGYVSGSDPARRELIRLLSIF
jgi:hypothetical protein